MFGVQSGSAFHAPVLSHGAASINGPSAAARRLALLANGLRHGPITRLITAWNVGELTAPFVFLDYGEVTHDSRPLRGIQPNPDIAALTLVLDGRVWFEDAAGRGGEVATGGLAWMNAAHGIWRGGGSSMSLPLRVFQLWISLLPSQAGALVGSEAIAPQDVEQEGPARVILGRLGGARSPIRSALPGINFFHVRLKDGQRWQYAVPAGHDVAWLAVDRGGLRLQQGERVYWEQIAVFGDSGSVIETQADGDTSFVVGSAKRQIRTLGEHVLAAGAAPLMHVEPPPGQTAAGGTRAVANH
jgi:redox-sensitive bicupin YhaK (pirin superfamily)